MTQPVASSWLASRRSRDPGPHHRLADPAQGARRDPHARRLVRHQGHPHRPAPGRPQLCARRGAGPIAGRSCRKSCDAIHDHGAVPKDTSDCQVVAADMDGAFPEGFYSTTNYRTQVRIERRLDRGRGPGDGLRHPRRSRGRVGPLHPDGRGPRRATPSSSAGRGCASSRPRRRPGRTCSSSWPAPSPARSPRA